MALYIIIQFGQTKCSVLQKYILNNQIKMLLFELSSHIYMT